MAKEIYFNDVALREADQVDGGKMNHRDQLTYVDLLLKGGINRIEIGYPGSSEEQARNCIRIVEHVRKSNFNEKPLLSALAPATKEMIDAVKRVGVDICHVYIPSSEEFIRSMFDAEKYGNSIEGKQQWVVTQSVAMVKYAKSLGFKHVQYSPEDAARSSKEFICRLVEAVINVGADIINIPDTTGLRICNEFGDLISHIKAAVPNIDKAKISVHCHNDSDNSTNNALQAILAGADIVEGTFYGLGERSGMTKFEAVLMVLETRKDVFSDIVFSFDIAQCHKIVHFIARALGMPVPRHWVVVGKQNSVCSSGTHQAIENRAKNKGDGYYSWQPEKYGHGEVETVINQSSGKDGLKKRIKGLGYSIKKDILSKVYDRAMKISDSKDGDALNDRELTAIIHDVIDVIPFPIEIVQCQAIGGKGTIPAATVIVEVNGERVQKSGTGNGPVNSTVEAVQAAVIHFYPQLKDYNISLLDWRPITLATGANAMADVYSRLSVENGISKEVSGHAVDPDTYQATAQSVANCFSWLLASISDFEN